MIYERPLLVRAPFRPGPGRVGGGTPPPCAEPRSKGSLTREKSVGGSAAHPSRERGRLGPWGRRGCIPVQPSTVPCNAGDATSCYFLPLRPFADLKVASSSHAGREPRLRHSRRRCPSRSKISSASRGAIDTYRLLLFFGVVISPLTNARLMWIRYRSKSTSTFAATRHLVQHYSWFRPDDKPR